MIRRPVRSDPALPERSELVPVLEQVHRDALAFLETLDERPVRAPRADAAAGSFGGDLPETGDGAALALRELVDRGMDAAVGNAGPRFYHLVVGGATPAALGADWLASALDQLAASRVTSPLAVRLESVALRWLRELFGLPSDWAGTMTTGAQMANFTCLGAARQWWGERHGVDVAQDGLADLPRVPVLSSGFLHASSFKALAMLGIGRASARTFSRDAAGRLDLPALEAALSALDGAPAIVVGNAGEVNAGEFDPIAKLADLCERYGAWLHVDGAFGLFARTTPKAAALADGVERAHSVTSDGHKWLNVPYDCGFAFVRDPAYLAKTFRLVADYLPDPDELQTGFSNVCPESSRRARALTVWATLRAYGRHGVRETVERHLAQAQRLAARVDSAPDLVRLADVPLNIVCFRYDPGGKTEEELDRINTRLGEAILADGRVFAGTTRFGSKVALRPAIVNWRIRDEDIDLFVDVVRELGARVTS